MARPTLIMMSKAPVEGRVKTRLAKDTSSAFAANLQKAFITDIADRFASGAFRTVVACAPDCEHPTFQELMKNGWELWDQGSGSLGERMRRARDSALDEGAGPVVFIGSDSPTLPKALVDSAFEALGHCELVLGPAFDGGYYLIGTSAREDSIFTNIPWGTGSVFSTTVLRLQEQRTRFAVLPFWYDVDDIDTLRHMSAHLGCEGPHGPIVAPHTEKLIRTLTVSEGEKVSPVRSDRK